MKKIYLLVVLTILLSAYSLLTLQETEVVHIERGHYNSSFMIVDHLPYTDKGKINWWLANRDNIKVKFNTPPASEEKNDVYSIFVWNIGDGFTNEKEKPHADLLCFDSWKTEKNCIDKDATFGGFQYKMEINIYSDGRESFRIVSSDDYYHVDTQGKVTSAKSL